MMDFEQGSLSRDEIADLRHKVNHTVGSSRQGDESSQVEGEHDAVSRVVYSQDGFLTENLLNIRRCFRRLGERFRIDAKNNLTSGAAHYLQDPARPQHFAHVVKQVEKSA